MRYGNSKEAKKVTRFLPVGVAAVLFLTAPLRAAVPGIQGPTFSLTASSSYLTMPDGMSIYSWGYGCTSSTPVVPAAFGTSCAGMQVPGPTLIVTEGQSVSVTLNNSLPAGAGNTSILFSGFQVTATGGVAGLRTQEATPASPVTYQFTASKPGTYSYFSGTQADLQIEMGLYGALIVLPATAQAGCSQGGFSLAANAYDHPATCYDREFMYQLAEVDPRIHKLVEAQAIALANPINVPIEPYQAAYFLVNGRSFPDDMDPHFAAPYPHQPYNADPHMHPGDLVLLRLIGQGRLQHPFHEHANHVRILARDGNLLLSQTDATKLAGPMLFTTTTTPGQTMDGIFYFTGRGLNWDMYDHTAASEAPCNPDGNGYFTTASGATKPTFNGSGVFTGGSRNYYEWCADHLKPLETMNNGVTTLPDPLILTAGLYYGGSAYLGPDATAKSMGNTPQAPGFAAQNMNAGWAYMWHSHNERELTTNNVFPGGMMMMMIVDAPYVYIDEKQ
jgi:FtsP/CotA-like multicopper oxidase with cupredoxin domain